MTTKRSTRYVYPLLALLLCGPAYAQRATSTVTPKPQRLDFEDDEVTGDVMLPDGSSVSGTTRARHGSLIRVRANFIAELVASTDDL